MLSKAKPPSRPQRSKKSSNSNPLRHDAQGCRQPQPQGEEEMTALISCCCRRHLAAAVAQPQTRWLIQHQLRLRRAPALCGGRAAFRSGRRASLGRVALEPRVHSSTARRRRSRRRLHHPARSLESSLGQLPFRSRAAISNTSISSPIFWSPSSIFDSSPPDRRDPRPCGLHADRTHGRGQ